MRATQVELSAIGYHLHASGELDEATRAVLRAFQRRWRPEQVSGEPDVATLGLIEDIAALVRAERAAA
jgi:N-acetyl-anhydromuramyl-L-alanine amidase AmpD